MNKVIVAVVFSILGHFDNGFLFSAAYSPNFRGRAFGIAIICSIPRQKCIMALQSAPGAPDNVSKIFCLRKAIDTLYSETQLLIEGGDIFTDHIIDYV